MMGTGRSGFQRAGARSEGDVGAVYFIACQNEFVKIGFARWDVSQRLAELQTGCPHELKLIGALHNVPMITEQWFHFVLREERVRGEWFGLTDKVRMVVHHINEGAYPIEALEVLWLYNGDGAILVERARRGAERIREEPLPPTAATYNAPGGKRAAILRARNGETTD